MSPLFLASFALLVATLHALTMPPPAASMDLVQPYQRGNWQAYGTTIFSPTQAILTTQRGTPGEAQRGALWNQVPFPYKHPWEMVFRAKFSGRGNDGEGLALWLVETPNELGPVFGSKDYFKGFVLVFDSFDNDKLRNNPSISAHYFDGTQKYHHEDDGLKTQIAGCIADYRNRKNTVAARIAYNGTHLSVYVDLTETGDYRKCIVEKFTMRDHKALYLGVSAETNAGPDQETQDVISLEVKGTPDWSRPAPPAVHPSWQQQQQQQQQQQYKAPEPAQQQYQAPEQQWSAPPAPPSTPSWQATDSEAAAVHDKLDQLMKAAEHTSLESASAGAALKELESNVMRHISGATKALFARITKLEGAATAISNVASQLDSLTKLAESNKGSVDAGRVDAERRFNEIETKITSLAAEVKAIKDMVERSTRTTLSLIDRKIRDGSQSMAAAASKGHGWSAWIYIALFQSMFVAFMLYRHMTNKKLDKLL